MSLKLLFLAWCVIRACVLLGKEMGVCRACGGPGGEWKGLARETVWSGLWVDGSILPTVQKERGGVRRAGVEWCEI